MSAHHQRRALILAVAGLMACSGDRSPAPPDSSRVPLVPRARPTVGVEARVLAWLTCIDCTDGELDAVLAAGDTGIGALGVAAASGLPADLRAMARDRALDARLKALGDSLVPGEPSVTLARAEAEADVAGVVQAARGRAYLALGRLGTPRARDLLDRAVQDSAALSPFLRAVVRRARDSVPP